MRVSHAGTESRDHGGARGVCLEYYNIVRFATERVKLGCSAGDVRGMGGAKILVGHFLGPCWLGTVPQYNSFSFFILGSPY